MILDHLALGRYRQAADVAAADVAAADVAAAEGATEEADAAEEVMGTDDRQCWPEGVPCTGVSASAL